MTALLSAKQWRLGGVKTFTAQAISCAAITRHMMITHSLVTFSPGAQRGNKIRISTLQSSSLLRFTSILTLGNPTCIATITRWESRPPTLLTLISANGNVITSVRASTTIKLNGIRLITERTCAAIMKNFRMAQNHALSTWVARKRSRILRGILMSTFQALFCPMRSSL